MSHLILVISGSPSENSRSTAVSNWFGGALTELGERVEYVSLNDFDLNALVRAKTDHPTIQSFRDQVHNAAGLVFSTPVYKATYAGALKLIIDLIDPVALDRKVLLGIATARIAEHLSEADTSFQRLYQFFKGSLGQRSLTLLDSQLGASPAFSLSAEARQSFDQAVRDFQQALP